MKHIAIIGLSLACLGASNSFAKDASKSFKKILSSVPAAELPAKAAQFVKDAKPDAWEETTINVVKPAVGINPAAAPAIVGAIARSVAPMAAVAAGTAAKEQPKQACTIAKAAAAAAPSQAGPIVLAVCKAAPDDYRCIAIAVSQAAPGSRKDILRAVAYARPELESEIEKALEGSGASGPSVVTTLDYATATHSPYGLGRSPISTPPGPSIGLPPGPPGGRNYAKP
jgi:hypothetical protein